MLKIHLKHNVLCAQSSIKKIKTITFSNSLKLKLSKKNKRKLRIYRTCKCFTSMQWGKYRQLLAHRQFKTK